VLSKCIVRHIHFTVSPPQHRLSFFRSRRGTFHFIRESERQGLTVSAMLAALDRVLGNGKVSGIEIRLRGRAWQGWAWCGGVLEQSKHTLAKKHFNVH
jgi:hypothetical protein